MRKWLTKQSTGTLIKIAHDCGYEKYDRTEAINFIVEYAKGYSLKVADFQARYQGCAEVHLVAVLRPKTPRCARLTGSAGR
jgi:hypothetical protein